MCNAISQHSRQMKRMSSGDASQGDQREGQDAQRCDRGSGERREQQHKETRAHSAKVVGSYPTEGGGLYRCATAQAGLGGGILLDSLEGLKRACSLGRLDVYGDVARAGHGLGLLSQRARESAGRAATAVTAHPLPATVGLFTPTTEQPMEMEIKEGVPPVIIPQHPSAPLLLPELQEPMAIARSDDGEALAIVAHWYPEEGPAQQVHIPLDNGTAAALAGRLHQYFRDHPDALEQVRRTMGKH